MIHAPISGQAESCLQATHTQPNPKERKNKGVISNFSTRILPFVICLFVWKWNIVLKEREWGSEEWDKLIKKLGDP